MENMVGIILNFLMILVILMMIVVVVIFIRSNIKVLKSRDDLFKFNLTGKKVVSVLFERWNLTDIKTRMIVDRKKERASYSIYNFASNELMLMPQVYKDKSVYAVAIAMYESIRIKLLREDQALIKKYVLAKRWFWFIIIVLVIFIFNPVTLIMKQRFLIVDAIQVLFLLLVVGGYILYINKMEKGIVNHFPEAFKEIPVLKKAEQDKILNVADSYHYVMMAKPDKFMGYRKGGNKNEK